MSPNQNKMSAHNLSNSSSGDTDVLSKDDKIKALSDFNNTTAGYPKNKTIQELFEEQAEKTPTHTAALFKDQALTYRELNEKANQLAGLLREKGVQPDVIVALILERSLEMIIGIWGILKAGGAYLPISPEAPQKRTEHMLQNSGVKIMLTQSKFVNKVKHSTEIETIDIEDEAMYAGDKSNLTIINTPADLAYVIYTSGSTGNPKGVMIEHRALINRLNWMQNKYPLTEHDTILQKTPFIFDVSVWELFWWSIVGAKVCFLLPGYEKYPQAIVETVEKNNITILHFVPSMLGAFLGYLNNTEEIKRLSSLKRVFASGEALTAAHVKSFNEKLFKENSTHLTNLYGPTEATVDVTYFDCPTGGNIEKIPIGKPIDNIRLYIINEDHLQAVGETGELCIAGDGLARGYLNALTLTNEKFVVHPLVPHERIYKTGDLARWLPDGNVEFLGRIDYQVKIRGLRIELGEIESVIMNHKAVINCVAIAKQHSETLIDIIAYITTREDISVSEIKNYAKNYLPDYMVPNIVVQLESFPFTSSGKIDRKALPDPANFKMS